MRTYDISFLISVTGDGSAVKVGVRTVSGYVTEEDDRLHDTDEDAPDFFAGKETDYAISSNGARRARIDAWEEQQRGQAPAPPLRTPGPPPGTRKSSRRRARSPRPRPDESKRRRYAASVREVPANVRGKKKKAMEELLRKVDTLSDDVHEILGWPLRPGGPRGVQLPEVSRRKNLVTVDVTQEDGTVIQQDKFECRVQGCGHKSPSLAALKNHQRRHDPQQRVTCDWKGCGKSLVNFRGYVAHFKVHTNQQKGISFKCGHCPITFSTKVACLSHELSHEVLEKEPCKFQDKGCDKTFVKIGSKQRHEGDCKFDPAYRGPYVCTRHGCARSYTYRRDRDAHAHVQH